MSLTVTEEVVGAEVVEGGVLAVVVGARLVDEGVNVMEDCPLAMATMATKMGTMNNAILLCKACTQYIQLQGPPNTICNIEVRTPQ